MEDESKSKVYLWKCKHSLCCGDEDKCTRESECQSEGKWIEKRMREAEDELLTTFEASLPWPDDVQRVWRELDKDDVVNYAFSSDFADKDSRPIICLTTWVVREGVVMVMNIETNIAWE